MHGNHRRFPVWGWRDAVAASCVLALLGCGGSSVSDPTEEPAPGIPTASAPPKIPDVLVYPDVSMGEAPIAEGIEALNAYRELAGLQPVVMDAIWAEACLGHLRYLDHASEQTYGGMCALAHDEPDEANPHFAPLHEQAGSLCARVQ